MSEKTAKEKRRTEIEVTEGWMNFMIDVNIGPQLMVIHANEPASALALVDIIKRFIQSKVKDIDDPPEFVNEISHGIMDMYSTFVHARAVDYLVNGIRITPPLAVDQRIIRP